MPARRLQSRSFAQRRRKRLIYGIALLIVAAASWLTALSFLTRLPAFAIASVNVFGADQDIAPTLQSAAQQALQGRYLDLFSRDSTIAYPRADVIAAVKAASPRIDDVAVSRDGLHGLTISVNEKTPAALVCADLPDFDGNSLVLDPSDQCYFTDASGFAYQAAPTISDGSQYPYDLYYVPDLSGVGTYATSTQQFIALQSFYDGARGAGIAVQGILVKDAGEYELYASNPASSGAEAMASSSTVVIYFDDQGSLPTELANLAVFWNSMTGPGRTAGAMPAFDSIDLRYGSDIFYRLIK